MRSNLKRPPKCPIPHLSSQLSLHTGSELKFKHHSPEAGGAQKGQAGLRGRGHLSDDGPKAEGVELQPLH